MTPAPRERRADARRNRGLLVAAARQVFDERGMDAPLDEIARRAHVGNATLYRHFPTRRDLVVEVYADEVEALCAHGRALLSAEDAGAALFAWLAGFAAHVAARRHVALSIPEDATGDRTRLFQRWHTAMHATAGVLVDRASGTGAIRADLTADDLLLLAYGIGLAAGDAATAARLLDLTRCGVAAVAVVAKR